MLPFASSKLKKKKNPAKGHRIKQAIANYLQHMPTTSSYLDFQDMECAVIRVKTSQRLGESVANATSSEKSKFNGWPKNLAKFALMAKTLPLTATSECLIMPLGLLTQNWVNH